MGCVGRIGGLNSVTGLTADNGKISVTSAPAKADLARTRRPISAARFRVGLPALILRPRHPKNQLCPLLPRAPLPNAGEHITENQKKKGRSKKKKKKQVQRPTDVNRGRHSKYDLSLSITCSLSPFSLGSSYAAELQATRSLMQCVPVHVLVHIT